MHVEPNVHRVIICASASLAGDACSWDSRTIGKGPLPSITNLVFMYLNIGLTLVSLLIGWRDEY